jgi:hypothetical protein
METKLFFFNENSKKATIKSHIKSSNFIIDDYIETIVKMKSGNKIGYFQFLSNEIYYKFYIMPKIYEVIDGECFEPELYIKQFINFFKHYYRLIAKYDIQKYTNELGGNISDLKYSTNTKSKTFSNSDLNDIDDFIVHNYNDSLEVLESFFIRHKKAVLLEHEFKSQNIKNKLHVKKNLLSLDKSYVHQIKKIPISFSDIALISIVVLKDFLNKKIRNFSNTNKALLLKKEVNKLINLLAKKLQNSKKIFHIKELLSRKISKQFERNNEYRIVYKALLKLSGKEHYYNGDIFTELKKEDETISLFFQPEKLFEWIVYDYLLENDEFEEVLKCDKDDIKENYTIEQLDDKIYSSEPDIIVKINDKIYPIDAKWKILSIKNDSFDRDISKLRRDSKIRNSNKGYLIYPKISESSIFQINKNYNYDFDKDFLFELKTIDIYK